MSDIFKFKQFVVDQSGCAMKINTDGVLLGAVADGSEASAMLDIGTGTGVISLMLAQRFKAAKIDAVEIDAAAAQTAAANFTNSPFNQRLSLHHASIQDYFNHYPDSKYDLIVSNPPFHIYSLESPEAKKNLARHTDKSFFSQLIKGVAQHLKPSGTCWLVLPLQTSALVKSYAQDNSLCVQQVISLQSYPHVAPHREMLTIGINKTKTTEQKFVIYNEPKVYSEEYVAALKDFFTIF
jgi:tRNA1Val (adenine37-N6)-methyltransferase